MLNTIVQPEEAPFYGIPFPAFFLLNEDGVIVYKFFNRHLAHPEHLDQTDHLDQRQLNQPEQLDQPGARGWWWQDVRLVAPR